MEEGKEDLFFSQRHWTVERTESLFPGRKPVVPVSCKPLRTVLRTVRGTDRATVDMGTGIPSSRGADLYARVVTRHPGTPGCACSAEENGGRDSRNVRVLCLVCLSMELRNVLSCAIPSHGLSISNVGFASPLSCCALHAHCVKHCTRILSSASAHAFSLSRLLQCVCPGQATNIQLKLPLHHRHRPPLHRTLQYTLVGHTHPPPPPHIAPYLSATSRQSQQGRPDTTRSLCRATAWAFWQQGNPSRTSSSTWA